MPSNTTGKGRCAVCGGPLPTDAAQSLCPRCALGGALELKPACREPDAGGRASEAGESGGGARRPTPESGTANRESPTASSFGDYELLEKVGEGGMGVVFKARQKSLDRLVAVKMLRLGPHAAPEFVQRFRAEAVAAASLQHPHIVAIHEVGSQQGQHFFVMDYVEGQSLARLVGNRPLPPRQAAQYVRTIAEAVHYAHERGILHRDLKPANVLVDTENQARVTDFGLARRLEGDSELTLTGQVLGSPHYMPPEQAAGKRRRVSRRTDVYGLGAILYHWLTGRPPFVGEELAETLQHVLNTDPVAPRLVNPAVPRDLETVCLKCLEKEPARRYAAAAAVADELGRYLQDQPIEARPVGRGEKVWRWCRRQPVRAGLLAALLMVLLLGALGVLWQWQRAEAGELRARQVAYAADMNLAFQAVEADQHGRALGLLNRYRPPDSKLLTLNPQGSTDLRGWEWRHLRERCESEAVHTLSIYAYGVDALAASGNGHWLAASTCSNIVIWDLVTRSPSDRLPINAVPAVVDLSADGSLLACGEADMTAQARDFSAVVFDTTTRTVVARFPHPGAWWLAQVAISPDRRVLATLDTEKDEGFVRLWSLETKECLYSIRVPPGSSMFSGRLRFSPDGRLLAIGQMDGRLRLIDRATGKVRRDIPPPATSTSVKALAFAPDGSLVVAGYAQPETNIHLWNVETGEQIGELLGHKGSVGSLCFLPDGQTLASGGSDETIRLWSLAERKESRRWSGHVKEVMALVALPDGKSLVSGGHDGFLYLWNTEHQKAGFAKASLTERVRGFAFTPDSRQVVTINSNGQVEAWAAATLRHLADLKPLGAGNLCLSLASRAGHLLLAAGTDAGWVKIWDVTSLAEPQLVASFRAHNSRVAALEFEPQGRILMSSEYLPSGWANSDARNFKAWDTSTWRERPEFAVGSHLVAHWPESDWMVVRCGPVGLDFALRDLRTGKERRIVTGHRHYLVALAFSPDERLLASGSFDGTVRLWEVGSWRLVATLPGMGFVRNVAFSPDGLRLATASNPVKLWDLATYQELASLPLEGVTVAFSPDGNTLAVRDSSGLVHFWRAPLPAR